MCPDPQLLSIYLDGELPSPWKEKLESHLNECAACKEKLNGFKQIFNKSSSIKSSSINVSAELSAKDELEMIEAAKDRVWQNLQSRRRFQPRSVNSNIRRMNASGFMQKRLSIPIPAAAAAALVIMLMTALWLRGGQSNDGIAFIEPLDRVNFILPEDEMQVLPVADISSVLQYLSSDGSDIIILRLPENKDFQRTGEPVIVRSADYTRQNQEHQSNRRTGEGSRPTRRNQ
ncbi:MAG: zf-HC2 domain-containing protein [Treponema sp.]|nr:zf-HC2 domain-containing protein [Treponema sp.]